MMTPRRISIALLFALLIVSFRPAPAYASGSTSAGDVILYDGCRYWPAYYSVNVSASAVDWTLELNVLRPDGVSFDSAYEYGDGSSGSGSFDMFFCGSLEQPGRYSIEGQGEWCDSNYDCYPFTLPTSRFDVRMAKTKTSLRVSDSTLRRNQIFTFFVSTKDERPNGYYGSDYASVVIQRKQGGKWVKARSGDVFIENGKGRTTYRWNSPVKKVKVRALRKADDNLGKSVSKVITLRSVRR